MEEKFNKDNPINRKIELIRRERDFILNTPEIRDTMTAFKFYDDKMNDIPFETRNEPYIQIEKSRPELTECAKDIRMAKTRAFDKLVAPGSENSLAEDFSQFKERRSKVIQAANKVGFYLYLKKKVAEANSSFELPNVVESIKKKLAKVHEDEENKLSFWFDGSKAVKHEFEVESPQVEVQNEALKSKLLEEMKDFEEKDLAEDYSKALETLLTEEEEGLRQPSTGDVLRARYDFLRSGSQEGEIFKELFEDTALPYSQRYKEWIKKTEVLELKRRLNKDLGYIPSEDWRETVFGDSEVSSLGQARTEDFSAIDKHFDVETYFDPEMGYTLAEYVAKLEKTHNLKVSIRFDSTGNPIIRQRYNREYRYNLDEILKFDYFTAINSLHADIKNIRVRENLVKISHKSIKVYNALKNIALETGDVVEELNSRLNILMGDCSIALLVSTADKAAKLSEESANRLLSLHNLTQTDLLEQKPLELQDLESFSSEEFNLFSKISKLGDLSFKTGIHKLIERVEAKFDFGWAELTSALLAETPSEQEGTDKFLVSHWKMVKGSQGEQNIDSVNQEITEYERRIKEFLADFSKIS